MIIHRNLPLAKILYYQIGGIARFVLEVSSSDDLFEAINFIQRNKIDRWYVVGMGTNLIMQDKQFNGAIIYLRAARPLAIHPTSDGLIAAFAGQTLDELIKFSFTHGFIGLELLGGLPSTIGGAIRGNAGAFGREIKDVIVKVSVLEVLQNTYKIHEFSRDDCRFAYRDSIFKHNSNLIIMKGFFHLESASRHDLEIARKIYREKIIYRKKRHPIEYPSCGSVFKNIQDQKKVRKILAVWPDIKKQVENDWHGKISMGYVIKRLGFSGYRVGGALITSKHANYISNFNHASARDVLEIIQAVKAKFYQTFGFYPELEAEIVDW